MIHRKKLQNDLRIIVEEIPTVRSVTIGIWIKTGSKYEINQENGISHFIEHMLFKGTNNRNAKEIAEAFDAIGGEVNAFTSKEYTCLYAKVLDTHQKFALEVLTDMLLDSVFDPEEIEREKKVITEEIHMTNDIPDDIIHDHLASISYKGHPLGQPILGTKENINAFTQEDLLRFMKKFYVANNMVVSIAGNVHQDFMDEVSERFSPLTHSDSIENSRKLPIFYSGTFMEEKGIEQAHIALGFEGLSSNHQDYDALVIVNNLLGGGMSSILFQEIREKHAMAYSIYSFHNSYEDSGLFTIYAGTSSQYIDTVEDQVLSIINDMNNNGISDEVFHRSKEQLKGLLVLGSEGTTSKMSRNASNEWLFGEVITIDEELKRIDSVVKEDIERVIKRISEQTPAKAVILPKN